MNLADANRLCAELDSAMNDVAGRMAESAGRVLVPTTPCPRGQVLTEHDVREMRRLRADGATQAALGAMFGVTRSAAQAVCSRRTWRDVE